MKKLLSIFALCAIALTGCVEFAEDAPVTLEEAAVPTISDVKTDDTSLTAKVTVTDKAAYFSYAVIEGEADELNATSLLKGLYEGDAETFAVCNTKDSTYVNVIAEGLTPNTPYTVYAVASTKDGVVSEIVTETGLTTDSTVPALDGYDSEIDSDGIMWLYASFDDPIELTGKGQAHLSFFAVNDEPDAKGNYAPIKTVDVPSKDLILDGSWLCVAVPEEEAQPGAYVFLTYDAGIVKNAVGGENKGLATAVFDGEDPDASKGIFEQFENKDWALVLGEIDENVNFVAWQEDTLVYFSDIEAFEYVFAPAEDIVPVVEDKAVIRYTYNEPGGRTVSYNYNTEDYIPLCNGRYPFAAAYFPETTSYGTTISLSLPEGVYQDIWGNGNEALEAKDAFFYSYGYEIEDITGTYTFNATAKYGGPQPEATVRIVPVKDVPDSVYVYGMFDKINCCDDFTSFENLNTVFKAGFDGDCGVLTFDYDAIGIGALASYGWNNYVLAMTVIGGYIDNFMFNVPAAGKLELPADYPIYIYCNGLGTWDNILSGTLVRISTDYSLPASLRSAGAKPSIDRNAPVKSLR